MTSLAPILAVLLAGIGVALQPPTNAALARAGGSTILASLISFAVGTAVLLAAWLATRQGQLAGLRARPPGRGWAGSTAPASSPPSPSRHRGSGSRRR